MSSDARVSYKVKRALACIVNDVEEAESALAELLERLKASQKEAFDACGVNDGWAMEVDRLTHELDQTGNYVTDREQSPQTVTFANGRRVRIVHENGVASLDVDWGYTKPDAVAEEAVKLLPPDFIDGIIL